MQENRSSNYSNKYLNFSHFDLSNLYTLQNLIQGTP